MSENLNLNDLEQVAGGSGKAELTTYTIKSGDTLTSIARKYKTTASKLFDLNSKIIITEANKRGVVCNNVNDYANHIWPGTILYVPNV